MNMKKLLFTYLFYVKKVLIFDGCKILGIQKANYGINYYPATLIFGYWGATVSNMSINTIIMTCKFYILKCARLKFFLSMKVI